jgi:hypothetical protein
MAAERSPRLIILQGRAGAGKDTVADIIGRRFDGEVARVSFADPLRAATLRVLRVFSEVAGGAITPEHFVDRRLKEEVLLGADGAPLTTGPDPDPLFNHVEVTPRVALRALAMVMRQEVGVGVWRDAGVEQMKRAVDGGADIVVVTDARFPSEKDPPERARMVEAAGFSSAELWWVVAPDGLEPTAGELAALPPSERDSHTGGPDHTVINDKSLGFAPLEARVAELL